MILEARLAAAEQERTETEALRQRAMAAGLAAEIRLHELDGIVKLLQELIAEQARETTASCPT